MGSWVSTCAGAAHALARLPRGILLGLSSGAACFFIAFFTLVLKEDSGLAVFLFDHSSASRFPYPLTIQNLMYLLFALSLGESFVRWNVANSEHAFLHEKYLSEDDTTVLRVKDLRPIRQKVMGRFDQENGFLPYLIDLCILQFQASRSVDQAVSVLNSSLELMAHRVDQRYAVLRYNTWAIPTLGFIGTVVGIASSLTVISPEHMDLGRVTASLSVAFNTTIIALVLSAVLVFLHIMVQKREELALNRAGSYCLKNLINRLFVPEAVSVPDA